MQNQGITHWFTYQARLNYIIYVFSEYLPNSKKHAHCICL